MRGLAHAALCGHGAGPGQARGRHGAGTGQARGRAQGSAVSANETSSSATAARCGQLVRLPSKRALQVEHDTVTVVVGSSETGGGGG